MLLRSRKLRWIKGFRYRTVETFYVKTNFRPHKELNQGRITLMRDGMLIVAAGYSSDGASGPTIDTPDIMPGATAIHDPGYELMRNGMGGDTVVDIYQPNERAGEGVVYTTPDEEVVVKNATREQIRREWDKMLADAMLEDGRILIEKIVNCKALKPLFLRFKTLPVLLDRLLVFRAVYFYDGVRVGGESSATVQRKVYEAP